MSAWWLLWAALVLTAEGALAWHCWRHDRHPGAGQPLALLRAGELTPDQRAVFLGSIAGMDVADVGGDR